MGRGHHRPRIAQVITIGLGLMMLAASCTNDSVAVRTKDPHLDGATGLAERNAFASSSDTLGVAGQGLPALRVEYFEAVRRGDWVAPDKCWFSTRVSIDGGLLESNGFDGPRSNDDVDAGEGVLVGSMASSITEPAPQASATTAPAPSAVPSAPPPSATSVSPEPAPTTTAQLPVSPPGEMGDVPGGATEYSDSVAVIGHPVVFALAAVYGHDQVAEVSTDDPGAIEPATMHTQPLDGWNLLGVAFDPGPDLTRSVTLHLRRIHEDGTETSQDLDIPLDVHRLDLVNDDWRFDPAAMDDSCKPPSSAVDNVPAETPRDLFGVPIGDAPELPPPGAPPADPATASDEALRAIRNVYDLSDIYALSKKDYVENPDDYLIMRDQLLANDVVAPYMGALDPVFRSLVFTSATEAAVLYKVGPSYQWEVGRVLLIDGHWRVAAGTVCRDLAAAGYTCPNALPDPRPGPTG